MRDAPPVSLAIWHGFSGTLALSVLTSFVSIGLFVFREPVRRILRPRALRTERVYTGALAGLDAISRTVAPALQSASLRSYALIVVVTGVAFVAAALVMNRILPTLSRWTPIALHEAVVAGLIVAAALSAAVARSNMAAALSLGAVGYGVALMYALFGAPDLAMTQFAVETLTVVIFVLVFYQLRGFGDLSSRVVKARDALVAIAAGVGHHRTRVVHWRVRHHVETVVVLCRDGADAGTRPKHRQRDPGRLQRLRHARGNDRSGHRRHRRQSAAPDRAGTTAMTSSILQTATRFLMPLLLLFAVFLLLRGHNEPGGGFVGGLVVAAAFVLYSIAYGVSASRRALLVEPSTLLGAGLLVAAGSGVPARAARPAVHDRIVDDGRRGTARVRCRDSTRVRSRCLSRRHRSGADHRLYVGRCRAGGGLRWNWCWLSSRACCTPQVCI